MERRWSCEGHEWSGVDDMFILSRCIVQKTPPTFKCMHVSQVATLTYDLGRLALRALPVLLTRNAEDFFWNTADSARTPEGLEKKPDSRDRRPSF